MAFIDRCGFYFINFTKLPGNVREAAALAAEGDNLIAVFVLMGFAVELQRVVVVEGHQHVAGAFVLPVHV